jgi:hypothetical protein
MRFSFVLKLIVICLIQSFDCQQEVYLGQLSSLAHGLSGHVFAINDKTLRLKNLHYDGQGPDAYFWAGNSKSPDQNGFIIADEKGSKKPLKGYNNANIVIRLPAGKSLQDINWFSVWCRRYKVNFGHIHIQ